MTGPSRQTDSAARRPAWPARIAQGLAGQRLRPLWILAAAAWVIFAAFRVGLWLAAGEFLSDVPAGQLAHCLLTGMRYDAMPIGCAMVPIALVLALSPNAAFAGRWFRRAVSAYAAIFVTTVLAVEIFGAGFFLHFGERLNWQFLDYLTESREIAAYIWHSYPVVWACLAAATALVGTFLLAQRVFWRGRRPDGPIWPRPILAAVLMALCFLGCRGSVDHHPLRLGPAYFSDNRAVCQLTLNNVFSVAQAAYSLMYEGLDEGKSYEFPSPPEAAQTVESLLIQPSDQPAGFDANPMWRVTDTGRPLRRPNVVLILMESMGGKPIGALGNTPSHSPNLDRLCREGLFLSRLYAVGGRTSHGLVGVLCGHPDLGAGSLLKRSRALGRFLTLPQILKDRGYRTLFFYGGNPDFDNVLAFFRAGGIDEFVGGDRMHAPRLITDWGYHDEVVFEKALETLAEPDGRPFMAVILTISNHEPYDVPAGRTEMLPGDDLTTKRLNAYRYADWAIGEFIRKAAAEPAFKDTVFVLVADHGRRFGKRLRLFDISGSHIPCVFYAPGLVEPGRIDAVASQADIATTLLALLGGSYEHCLLGRDMLQVADDDGFALLQDGHTLVWVDDDRTLILRPDGKELLFASHGSDMERIKRPAPHRDRIDRMRSRMLSYYCVSRRLYLDGAYNPPTPP